MHCSGNTKDDGVLGRDAGGPELQQDEEEQEPHHRNTRMQCTHSSKVQASRRADTSCTTLAVRIIPICKKVFKQFLQGSFCL